MKRHFLTYPVTNRNNERAEMAASSVAALRQKTFYPVTSRGAQASSSVVALDEQRLKDLDGHKDHGCPGTQLFERQSAGRPSPPTSSRELFEAPRPTSIEPDCVACSILTPSQLTPRTPPGGRTRGFMARLGSTSASQSAARVLFQSPVGSPAPTSAQSRASSESHSLVHQALQSDLNSESARWPRVLYPRQYLQPHGLEQTAELPGRSQRPGCVNAYVTYRPVDPKATITDGDLDLIVQASANLAVNGLPVTRESLDGGPGRTPDARHAHRNSSQPPLKGALEVTPELHRLIQKGSALAVAQCQSRNLSGWRTSIEPDLSHTWLMQQALRGWICTALCRAFRNLHTCLIRRQRAMALCRRAVQHMLLPSLSRGWMLWMTWWAQASHALLIARRAVQFAWRHPLMRAWKIWDIQVCQTALRQITIRRLQGEHDPVIRALLRWNSMIRFRSESLNLIRFGVGHWFYRGIERAFVALASMAADRTRACMLLKKGSRWFTHPQMVRGFTFWARRAAASMVIKKGLRCFTHTQMVRGFTSWSCWTAETHSMRRAREMEMRADTWVSGACLRHIRRLLRVWAEGAANKACSFQLMQCALAFCFARFCDSWGPYTLQRWHRHAKQRARRRLRQSLRRWRLRASLGSRMQLLLVTALGRFFVIGTVRALKAWHLAARVSRTRKTARIGLGQTAFIDVLGDLNRWANGRLAYG